MRIARLLALLSLTLQSVTPARAETDICRAAKTALEKIDRCTLILSSSTKSSQIERALLRRGNAFMEMQRYGDAASDFTRLITLNPRVAGFYDNRANAYKAMGALSDALKDANTTIRMAPTGAFAYRTRAMIMDGMGKSEPALADMTTAISLAPTDAGLFVDRGLIEARLGRVRDALADFSRALDANPDYSRAIRERGLLHKQMHDYDEALEDLRLYARLQPGDLEVGRAIDDLEAARASAAPAKPQPPHAPSLKSNEPETSKSGTGFFVSTNGHIVTNDHVVDGCRALHAKVGASAPVAARLVAHDPTNDLALLSIETGSTPSAAIRSGAKIGEPIAAFGYPLSGLLSTNGVYSIGTVSSLAGMRDDARYLQISAPIQPGNSGGPVVDQSGNVVGVVVSKLDAIKVAAVIDDLPQNVNFAIKASVLANFLEAHGVSYTQATPQAPLAPTELADRARAISVFIRCGN